mmetsp:Transcript_20297/g.47426  ORF Transcript_20297/g.47426 Transcript_20297/m.47426 type:complete len:347 (+) Transcript_20297:46-1086(+)
MESEGETPNTREKIERMVGDTFDQILRKAGRPLESDLLRKHEEQMSFMKKQLAEQEKLVQVLRDKIDSMNRVKERELQSKAVLLTFPNARALFACPVLRGFDRKLAEKAHALGVAEMAGLRTDDRKHFKDIKAELDQQWEQRLNEAVEAARERTLAQNEEAALAFERDRKSLNDRIGELNKKIWQQDREIDKLRKQDRTFIRPEKENAKNLLGSTTSSLATSAPSTSRDVPAQLNRHPCGSIRVPAMVDTDMGGFPFKVSKLLPSVPSSPPPPAATPPSPPKSPGVVQPTPPPNPRILPPSRQNSVRPPGAPLIRGRTADGGRRSHRSASSRHLEDISSWVIGATK